MLRVSLKNYKNRHMKFVTAFASPPKKSWEKLFMAFLTILSPKKFHLKNFVNTVLLKTLLSAKELPPLRMRILPPLRMRIK